MGAKVMNQRQPHEVDEGHSPEGRVILKLGGQLCEFDLPGVEQALLKVAGVKAVDLKTMKGAALVTYEAGNVSPTALIAAVRSVKGDGYHCTAKVMPD
jgi:copper chaperone CopZ